MTTAAEQSSKDKAEALKARDAAMATKEKELNKDRTGVGTRVFLGMTRGRNTKEIQYENWDSTIADSLPVKLEDFMSILKGRGVTDETLESEIVRRLILGDNEILYSEASDPVAEFYETSWDDEQKKNFRLVVKNYAANANVSLDDAVELLKPGISAAFAKANAAKSVKTEEQTA